jgi:hypothetical protein
MRRCSGISLMLICLLCTPMLTFGAENVAATIMPAPSCADGWTLDGNVTFFDKDTLFDRINGESELYFPYGFVKLSYARYENKLNPAIAVDADVYKMGSLLDAFGMFANYRRKDDAEIAVGAQGTISSSQVFFYQDRYFVRLQATGTTSISKDVFLDCAGAISRNLPKSTGRPRELDILDVPGVLLKSERYVAQSLLGYDFFRRGLIADALVMSEQVQIFVVIEQSAESAGKTLDQYRVSLKSSGSETHLNEVKGRRSLEAIDPLYGMVYAELVGRFVVGAVRIRNLSAAKELVDLVRARVGKELAVCAVNVYAPEPTYATHKK